MDFRKNFHKYEKIPFYGCTFKFNYVELVIMKPNGKQFQFPNVRGEILSIPVAKDEINKLIADICLGK
jgi:hypothetical protein